MEEKVEEEVKVEVEVEVGVEGEGVEGKRATSKKIYVLVSFEKKR